MIYCIGDLQLDTGRRLLTRNGRAVKLTKLCFDVLKVLVEAAPDLVSHDKLIDRVWGPNRVITPENLAQRIHILRESLGDDADNPTYIQVVRGQGFRLIPTVYPDVPRLATPLPAKRQTRLPVVAAIAMIGTVIAWTALDRSLEPPARADRNSIAVLPFKNIGGDASNEYLADGISEEILTLLAQIKPLRVIARTSSFTFKDKNVDIPTIAQQLNVQHILEGSIQMQGQRIRITAQLIDTDDSSHLWSQSYDRDLTATSVFQVESEIARTIARQLQATLTEPEERQLAKIPTYNIEAYAAYLLGRDRLRDPTVNRVSDAVEQFALAISLDAEYAAAYAGLAQACEEYYGRSVGRVHPNCPPAVNPDVDYREYLLPLVRKALALDNSVGEAWIIYAELIGPASVTADSDRIDEITAAYERGLELNPGFSEAYSSYSSFLYSHARYDGSEPRTAEEDSMAAEQWYRDWQQGLWQSVVQRGLEVDPLSLTLHRVASYYYLYAATPEEAMYHARRIMEIAPDSPLGYRRMAELSWLLEGRIDQAIKWIMKSAEIDPLYPHYWEFLSEAYSALGDFDTAGVYFEHAKELWAPEVRARPSLDEALLLLYSGRREEATSLLEEMQDYPMIGNAHPPLLVLAGLDIASGDAEKALARYRQHWPMCFDKEPGDAGRLAACPVYGLPRVYQELGDYEWGRTLLQEGWDHGGAVASQYWKPVLGRASTVFGHTARLALMGRPEEALDWLEEGVTKGWRGGLGIRTSWRFFAYFDTRVDSIRDHPRFRAAIATIKVDMDQQLEIVRAMERRGEIPYASALLSSLEADETLEPDGEAEAEVPGTLVDSR